MKSPLTGNFRFADFELDRAKRLLIKSGEPVPLNSKTFDLLEALIDSRGKVVGREELLTRVWPDQFVEESNLTVHVSTLRKTLGESLGENKFIVTVPGKGYKFVAEGEADGVEFTIEKHRYSRVIVSDEIVESEPHTPLLLPAKTRRIALLAVVGIFLGLLAGGFLLYGKILQPSAVPFLQTRVRQLTTNGKVQIATMSPDGQEFAFVTDDLGIETLWLGRIDGGSDVLLRNASESTYKDVKFSPDGREILFSILDDANPKLTIYRMPAFGGVAEKVREDIGSFAIAPDGEHLAYFRRASGDKSTELIVAEVRSSAEKILATLPGTVLFRYGALSFSPDGQSIAFGGGHAENPELADLFIAKIETGDVSAVTNKHFGDINLSSWLPDGTGLVITAFEIESRAAVPQYHVWYIGLPDGEARKITSDLSSYADALGIADQNLLTIESRQLNNVWIAPADNLAAAKQITNGSFGKYDGYWGLDWLPDGRIVFDSSDQVSQAISIMGADGSDRRQVTVPGNVDSALAVSPDGRYIVFHSTRGGGTDIWRIDADGSNAKQLTFTKQSYQPFVSADIQYVYFKSWDDGMGEMRRVPIDGGESVALTDKETSWTAASPDGRFIAASYRTDKRRLAIFGPDGGVPIKQFDLPKTGSLQGGARWTPDNASVVYGDAAYGYWQQSLSGGEPKRVQDLPKEKLYNFAWSRDGKQFAFVRGTELRDVVLIINTK